MFLLSVSLFLLLIKNDRGGHFHIHTNTSHIKRQEVAHPYQKFEALKPAKREHIVMAAMKEFALNGYEKASTNMITKEAGISKGSLFAYFNSKQGLYLFLLEYTAGIIEKIYQEVDMKETDLFNRIRDIGLAKFKIYRKYPHVFLFLKTVSNEEANEVKNAIDKTGQSQIREGLGKIYKNIDLEKFRDDIDIQKTINIINWTMLNFAEQQMNNTSSIDDYNMERFTEWDEYANIMRRCFYKNMEA